MNDRNDMTWDSANWREVRNEQLAHWLLGDLNAVKTFLICSQIAEVWDDLIDGDPTDKADVNDAFASALIKLQVNPFYQQHQGMLLGVTIAGINAWMDSVELEKGSTTATRMHAFYLRNFCYELLNVCTFCVGGWEHMRAVSMEMRHFFTHETYAQWEHAL